MCNTREENAAELANEEAQRVARESKLRSINVRPGMVGCLSISTGHIPGHTANALGHDEGHPDSAPLWDSLAYTFWSSYGWIILANQEQADVARAEGHPELADLIELCLLNDMAFLQLDADATLLEGLPKFEW